MNILNDDNLSRLSEYLFRRNIQLDKKLENNQEIIKQIDSKYDPRIEFERWKNSKEGQLWKKQQYDKQRQCCAICQKKIEIKWSHIDHIKPICHHPEFALVTSNLQVSCASCNVEKGSSEV